MVANRSLLVIAFLLILLAGSLEARPRTIVLSILVPEDSPSPSNEGPYGSSMLFRSLEEQGFRVAIAPQARDLERLTFNGNLVTLFIIGSDYLSGEAAQGLAEAIRYIASDDSGAGGLAVIIADEAPGEAMLELIHEALISICGNAYFTIVAGSPGASSRLAVFGPEGDRVFADAGAAGFIASTDPRVGSLLAMAALSAARGETTTGTLGDVEITVFAFAAPSPIDGSPVPVPAGVACRSERGSVVLLADSSLLLNGSGASSDVGRILVSWAFPRVKPEEVVVLTVQEAYVGGGGSDIAVSIHPSLVMAAIAQALPHIERGLSASIRSVPLLALGFIASTTLLLAALASGGREGLYATRSIEREVNRGARLRGIYKGVLARWLGAGFLARLKRLGR